MQAEQIKIKDLKAYQLNAKQHPKSQIKGIAESIKMAGFIQPIVVDSNNEIIIGHGRLAAAHLLNMTEVPCVRIEHLNKNQVKALRLIDNRIAETGWDNSILIEDLADLDFNFADFNIDFDFLGDAILKKNEGNTDEDEVPEPPKEPISKLGDVWLLGDHRLMCGDSTDMVQVNQLLAGAKIDLIFTDPPYGIDEETDRVEHVKTFKKQGVAKKGSYSKIIGDDSIETALKSFLICDEISKNIVFWGGNYYCHKLPVSPCWLVWDKRVDDTQRDLNSDCELAYVKHPYKASVRIFRHLWKGMIKDSERGDSRVHPTQKPIALAEWSFKEYSPDGKTVLDLFGGSGSTLIACEKTNRKCYGMELDPTYCDVIINRWQNFTGKEAIHEGTGKKYFDQQT